MNAPTNAPAGHRSEPDPDRPQPTIGQKYTVQEGDTITEIAFVAYGDARRYVELVAHNADLPGFNPARLQPGLQLDVPEPDYLPLPGGVGGFRASAGRSFSLRPVNGGQR